MFCINTYQMELQLEMMRSLMERSQVREDDFTRRAKGVQDQLKLTKLADSEDIEAYLTTFERLMQVYERAMGYFAGSTTHWKCTEGLCSFESRGCNEVAAVKAAILRRYNITEETYRQRFRSDKTRIVNCLWSWMAGCKTVEEVK